ncbi:hypothetical protein [Pedobacter sp. WC2423]|uniref:hypothetical protein n=1 Tax=Pedobacter sp. WC2423 TaxID=3234142 RepID=UPI003466CC90
MEALSTFRTNYRNNGHSSRCRKRSKYGTEVVTGQPIADGFLNHRFLPVYEPSAEKLPDQLATERDFFDSVSIFAKAHNFEPLNVKDKPYPYNILLAYWHCYAHFENNQLDTEMSIVINDDNRIVLTTKQTFDVSYTLYYIPVLPLYKLLRNKKQKDTADLLLSVFAYLYDKTGIPFYRDEGTFLYDQYDMLRDCLEWDQDCMEEYNYRNRLKELNDIEHIGDVVKRILHSTDHLAQLRKRIDDFHPKNETEQLCLNVAKHAYYLAEKYPYGNVFDHMYHDTEPDDPDFEYVSGEQIISFVYNNIGSICDELCEYVRDNYANTGCGDQPTIFKTYDSKFNQDAKSLDFTIELFRLIDDLCFILNKKL